jgi:ERF superfamily
MTVHKKLMHARCQLLLAKLEKTGHNKFAGYKYFELGDFLPAVHMIFEKVGLCGVVSFGTEFATLTITDVDDGTMIVIQSPMATASLKGAHEIQNLGAVESYQRRYLWMTAMELCENDPIDSSPPVEVKVEEPPKKYKPVNPKPAFPKDSKEFPGLKEIGEGDDAMVEWQIKLKSDDGKGIVEATKLAINSAQTPEDVQSIYRVNKAHYERLKTEFPPHYEELLDMFKSRKEELK